MQSKSIHIRRSRLVTVVLAFMTGLAGAQDFYPVYETQTMHGQGYEEFGNAVAMDGAFALAGAWREDSDSNGLNPLLMAGAAYFFYRDVSDQWQMTQKVTAPDREASDFYGTSVALTGDYAVIGAAGKNDPSGAHNNSGAAYVYKNIAGSWEYIQILRASDSEADALFGYSVSISGEYIFVGAPYEDKDQSGGNPLPEAGAIYVFHTNTSGDFTEIQKIVASNRSKSSLFGSSVSVSGDHLAAGAPNSTFLTRDNNMIDGVGMVYTFKLGTDSTWYENQQIIPEEANAYQSFGKDLSLDDGLLIIGSPGDGYDEKDRNFLEGAGSAVIWYYSASNTWKMQDKIVAADRKGFDAFGWSVSLDGTQAIIGARNTAFPDADNIMQDETGMVYVFQKLGLWKQIRQIVPRDFSPMDHFGHAVAGSQNNFIVGTPNKTKPAKMLEVEHGKVYFYEPCSDVEATSDFYLCEGDSVFLQGDWRGTEGVYIDTIMLPFGYDSLATTNLFHSPIYQFNASASICEGDSIWLGNGYQKMPGTYIDSLQSTHGCDSVIVTTLTVLPSYEESRNVSICEGDSLFIGNAYRETAGIYYDRYTSVSGCDSTIEIRLEVLPVYEVNHSASICTGDSIWLFTGFQKTAGVYFDTLTSYFGCDSIIITSLVVHALPEVDLGGDTTLCEGTQIILDAGQGFSAWNWNDGLSDTQTINVLTSGTYYVEVTDNNGCQGRDTIRISYKNCSTSILDPSALPDVLIYPNPVNDILNVEIGSTYFGNTLSYALYNLNGRELLVKEQDLSSRTQFDLSGFPSGIYLLRMSNGQDQRTIKLIKK